MLSFASATGNLYNRLGRLALLVKQFSTYQGSQETNLIDPSSGATAQYNTEPDLQAQIGNSYVGLLNSGGAGSLAQSVARATVDRMVYRDNPRPGQTLTQPQVVASIVEVLRQMRAQGATVLAQTIGTSCSAFTGTGNGVLVASTKRPFDGLVLENAFAEALTVTCQSDSYSSTATAGNEPFTVQGEGAQTNLFAFDWPLGSGASTRLNAIDGNSDNTSGNLLTNSGFGDWTGTGSFLASWERIAGTVGSSISQDTGITYDGSSSLRLTGDAGGTQQRWRQRFNDSSGTAGTLSTLSQYGVNVFLRRDGTASDSGELTVRLADAAGVPIQDENGVDNSFTIDLTALTTGWVAFNAAFRTPSILPSAVYLDFYVSDPLDNGRSAYLDKAAFGLMTQAYRGGIFLANFAGSVPYETGDYATCTVSNSRGAGGTLHTWQTALYRLLAPDWAGNEFLAPSSATPSISDSLIG